MSEPDPVPGEHDKHAAHRRLVERLRSQAQEIDRLTRGLDDDALSERTVSDKWSLKELVCHLWRVQRLFDDRIEAMLTTAEPVVGHHEAHHIYQLFQRRLPLGKLPH